MPDRKSLISVLWLSFSVTLMGSVLVAPIRASGCVAASSRPDSLRRDFTLPPGQPTTHLNLIAATATDAVLLVNALPFEDEEQDRVDVVGEPPVPFLIPCSFRKVSDRQLIAPRSILSTYPLRC